MPRGNQIGRQWQLLQLLGHPTGLKVDEAAHHLGCAVRTVWRDLKVLQEVGFPIYDDRDGAPISLLVAAHLLRRTSTPSGTGELAAGRLEVTLRVSGHARGPPLAARLRHRCQCDRSRHPPRVPSSGARGARPGAHAPAQTPGLHRAAAASGDRDLSVAWPSAPARQPSAAALLSLARYRVTLDIDFRELIDQAGGVRLVRDETRWTSWTRYSALQDRRMEWSGLVGRATYEGDLRPFWPSLVFGQWTHVGKATTFGLGGYRLEPIGVNGEENG